MNFSKHGCNVGAEEEPCFGFRIVHVFIHACEACCKHLSNIFARRLGEGCNFELAMVYENVRHRMRNLWKQEQITAFVKFLSLGSWTEREFRK